MSSQRFRRIIGIDFGTSTSVVCFKDYIEGQTNATDPKFVYFNFQPAVPTLVYTAPNGAKYYGTEALTQSDRHPENLYANFKMGLSGSPTSPDFQNSEALMREFFAFLRKTYLDQRSLPYDADVVEDTIVSYPAKWPFQTQETTVAAAKAAGFSSVKGLAEPLAAMQFFFSFETEQMLELTRLNIIGDGKPVTILLIDMGAGTTDLALYRYICGRTEGHEVLGTWPTLGSTHTFGGHELDDLLATFVKDEFLEKNQIRCSDTRFKWLKKQCKNWKENDLSPTLARDEKIADEPGFLTTLLEEHPITSRFPSITRDSFEDVFGGYLTTFCQMVDGLIGNAVAREKIAGPQDIDLVLLTGGHSRWYFVREYFEGKWPTKVVAGAGPAQLVFAKIQGQPLRVLQDGQPELTVARGLALSGQPIRFRKISSNGVWLRFTIGGVTSQPITILRAGEPLPATLSIQQQFEIGEASAVGGMVEAEGTCIPLVGDTLASAVALKEYPFACKGSGAWLAGLTFGVAFALLGPITLVGLPALFQTEKRFARLFCKITVDEREEFSVLGIIELTSHKPAVFTVNREQPTEQEKQTLTREFEKTAKTLLEINTFLAAAAEHLKKQQYDAAVKECANALALDQTLADTYNLRGCVYLAQGDRAKALADLSKAIDLAPFSYGPLFNRARAHLLNNASALALEDLNAAIRMVDTDADCFLVRGLIFQELGRYDEAVTDFDRGLELAPGAVPLLFQRAQCYRISGKFDLALNDISDVIAKEPKNADAFTERGLCYEGKGSAGLAISCYSHAMELDAKSAERLLVRGRAYVAQKRWDEAISDFTAVLRNDPKNVDALYCRGIALSEEGKWADSIADFSEALKLSPQSVAIYLSRGLAYEKLCGWDQAIADYTEAIKRDPNCGSAYCMRGECRWARDAELSPVLQRGENEAAIADFTQAIRTIPRFAGHVVTKIDADGGMKDIRGFLIGEPGGNGESFIKLEEIEKAWSAAAEAPVSKPSPGQESKGSL